MSRMFARASFKHNLLILAISGGHKANLANPNTSQESKEHSKQVLDDLADAGTGADKDEGKNAGNVAGGYKA